MVFARPSKRLVLSAYQFFFDRYSLISAGFKLVGIQLRSDGQNAVGYLFGKASRLFLGTHVVHQLGDILGFHEMLEKYDKIGILVPTGSDIDIAASAVYNAYQLTSRGLTLQMLEGPMRARLRGPWSRIVLGAEAEKDRRLRAIWHRTTQSFRGDAVARVNTVQRITVPTWFAAYWVDQISVAAEAVRRPRRIPPRSRRPKLPVTFKANGD